MQKQVTLMSLPTLRLQCLSSTYVMCVTPYATKHLRVTTLAPFTPPSPPVPNFNEGIVMHATGWFLVTSVTKIVWPWEWRASWSVSVDSVQELRVIVTSDCKLGCFKTFRNICNNKQPSVRLCCVAPHKPGQLSQIFMEVLFDTECA